MQENQNATANNIDQQEEQAIDLKAIFFLCLSHWYWFLISVILCLALATFYLKKTTPVYTRSAKVLVKSDDKGRSSMKVSDFSDLGLFTNGVNINNELLTIQSIDNVEEVVRRLQLDKTYNIDGLLHSVLLYGGSLPIQVEMPGIADYTALSFDVKIQGTKLTLSEFKLDKEEKTGSITANLGDTVASPVGVLCVRPTEFFNPKNQYKTIHFRRSPIGITAMGYASKLTVALAAKQTDVMTLTMNDISKQRADDFINMLIVVYNGNWLKDKNQVTVSTSMFINDRLQLIEKELGSVDDDISSYKSANLLPDVAAVTAISLNQSTITTDRILDLNNQIAMTRYVRNYLVNMEKKDQLLPVNSGVGNAQIESQIAAYNNMMLKRNNLMANSSEQSPLVREMDDNLAKMRQSIVATLDNQLETLNTLLLSFQGTGRQINSRLAASPGQAKYLLSVERQQKVKESLYLFLLQKREENELSQAFTAYNTRVIEKPNGSPYPTKPKKTIIRLIAIVLGLAIPGFILFMIDYLNTTVRSRKDLEKLSVPLVGEIPLVYNPEEAKKNKKKKKMVQHDGHTNPEGFAKTVVVKHGSRNVINEAFRVFRTNLEFMTKSKENNVFMFTSFNPGSGKSFIAINSAISLAIKKRKVLVIDGDLRHASLSAYIFSPKKGIANYLGRQEEDINKLIIQSDDYPYLSYLPVGTIPPNPTELLEDERFGELIKQLRQEYDYVMIDCPPIDIVADPQIINKYVDRTIFVVRAGLMERSLIPELEKLYTQHKYVNLCMMLNGSTNSDGRYGYRYGYHYGYGYKYGYHNAYGEKSAYGGYYHEDDEKTEEK